MYDTVISQTPKNIWNMFDFNMISNLHGYLALFVPKTPSVVWYFITDLIPPKVHGYFTLFESKSAVIFIFVHCLIIFFKIHKFTQTLCRVFPSPNLNSYIVFLSYTSPPVRKTTSPQWCHLWTLQARLPWWPPFSQHVLWRCCNPPGIPSSMAEILLFNSVFHDRVAPVSVSTLKPPLGVIGVLPLKPWVFPITSVCI